MGEQAPILSHAEMKRAMRISVIDGMLASASENLIGPFLALCALAMGASKGQIGLLAALPAFLSNVLQIPSARLTERWGQRQKLVVICSGLSRLTIIPIILTPMLLEGDAAIYTFIVLVTLRGFINSIGVPGWTSLMADITPRSSRGSYFGYRNIMSNLAALVGTLLAGWLIERSGFPGGYQMSFAVALVLGLLSTYFFSTIPSVPMPKKNKPQQRSMGLRASWQAISQYTAFRNYCFTSVLWNFGVTFSGALYSVYFRENLGGDPGFWGVVTASGLIAGIFGHRYWGKLADQYGQKAIMLAGGMGAASLPFIWWLLPRWQLAAVAELVGGFCWAGYNLAAFNLILEITPDEERTMYIGVYNTLAGLASSIGPLIGGFLADSAGLPTVILISGILRWAGYFVFKYNVPVPTETQLGWRDLIPFSQEVRLLRKQWQQRHDDAGLSQ
ncbi:MAG: MFS transporter [Firmicutes bacterium]|jgi:MFS family permease|nr:MFS transporter [Bacillota bacterium]